MRNYLTAYFYIGDGMFLVQPRLDWPSTFGGEANVTLSRIVRPANHVDFA